MSVVDIPINSSNGAVEERLDELSSGQPFPSPQDPSPTSSPVHNDSTNDDDSVTTDFSTAFSLLSLNNNSHLNFSNECWPLRNRFLSEMENLNHEINVLKEKLKEERKSLREKYRMKNRMTMEMDCMRKHIDCGRREISERERKLLILSKGIERLDELKENDHEHYLAEVVKLMKDLKRTKSNSVRKSINMSVNLLSQNYPSTKEFLYDIYRRICNGQAVFAVHVIKNSFRYGRISVEEDTLRIHCLSKADLSTKDILTVWFEEMMRLMEWNYAFLKIVTDENRVQRTLSIHKSRSHNSHNFFRICSGELGFCYKGAKYELQAPTSNFPLFSVKEYMFNGSPCSKPIFSEGENVLVKLPSNVLCVQLLSTGGFKVFRTEIEGVYGSVDGTVVYPLDLLDILSLHLESKEILDCGIVLKLT